MDYLKLTVWADVDHVLQRVEDGLMDRYFADEYEGWRDLGPGGRLSNRWHGVEGVTVLEYGQDAEYCSVEVKGSACAFVGNEGVQGLLADFAHVRARASRFDAAWDGVPFDVAAVREAVIGGNVRTRLKLPEVPEYRENEQGTTVYVGRRESDRYIRVYDRRGPVRFEVEFKGDVAGVVVGELSVLDAVHWPGVLLGHVRGTLDFVDASADANASRRPLLDWWAAFVEREEKRSASVRREDTGVTEIGKLDALIKRSARRLEAGRRAYGDRWLLDRISYWVGQLGGNVEIDAIAAELDRWRGTGVGGAPEKFRNRYVEEAPF